MNAFALTLILKSSLLVGAAAAADFLMRRRTSSASRHLVWTLALSGVLLLPLLTMVVPSWGIPIQAASSGLAPDNSLSTLAPSVEAETTEPSEEATGAAGVASTNADPASAPFPRALPWPVLALALYLAGVGALGLRLVLGRRALRRLVLHSSEVTDPAWRGLLRGCGSMIGSSQRVRLLRSLDRSMPMAFGLLEPTILIPAIADTWAEDRKRAVLLHELAHIDRRDCLTQLLAELCCAAYWMHPGVWWGARRLRIERELACDDRVLSAGEAARDYAAHLLELAYSLGGFSSPALAVSMARPRQLEGRLLAVLDAARNRVSPPRLAPAIGLVATTTLLVPLAAAEAVMIPGSPAAPAMVEWSEPVAAPEPQSAPAPAPVTARQPSTKALAAPTPVSPERKTERRREVQLPGTWEVRLAEDGKTLHVQLSDRPNSNHGFTTTLDQFEGLPVSLLTGNGGASKFSLRRDAGTLEFDGVFRTGVGAGTFDFTPSPTFPAEMVKRGFASPSALDQYELARGNIGFAYLDELNAQKYEKPNLDDLVQAANHGVHLDYLKGMGEAGYHFGRIDVLIRNRDHGVTPAYIRGLAEEGLTHLPAEDLLRARDHGVTPEYVGAMRAFGYKGLSLDELLRARDHGVSADFIRNMAGLGYQAVPLPQLVRARDHGVTPDYVKALREAGYGVLSIDELVNGRDHGVSAEFVREMASLGPERASLNELAAARDRGVSADFARTWRDLGYPPILADMAQARQHGVSAEFIRSLKALGYDRLSVEDLIRLRDHGVSADFARERNADAKARLSVEELVRLREGRGESRRR